MLNKKNVGRPRRDDLTKQLKCNVDETTAKTVKQIAKSSSMSQADVLREIIPIVSSMDFEGMLPHIALTQLQKYSDNCWLQLHAPNSIFKAENFSDYVPAFITTWNPPMVYVKYPTYKVHIYDKTDPALMTDQPAIEKILAPIPLEKRSRACYTQINYLIRNNSVPEMSQPFVNEVLCLSISLEENTLTKDSIVQLLKSTEYAYSVYPAYCIRGDYIELIDNGKYFKLLHTNPA